MSSSEHDTRETILAAAHRLFASSPHGEVRLADVAEESGYSRQAIYLHFGSRSGLLVALVRYVDKEENLAELARPIWDARSGTEALDELVHLNAVYTPRIYPVARILINARHDDQDLADAYDDRMDERRRACRRIILRLKRENSLAPGWDVEAAIDVLYALISIQLWELLVVDGRRSPEEYERQIRRLARGALLQHDDNEYGNIGEEDS